MQIEWFAQTLKINKVHKVNICRYNKTNPTLYRLYDVLTVVNFAYVRVFYKESYCYNY